MNDRRIEELEGRLRSLPRYEPRLSFRLKVALLSISPRFGALLSANREARRPWGPRSDWARPQRFAGAAAVVLMLAFIAFSGLMLASGGSLPGDPLYSLKRARENLGLAFTRSPADKAERRLALASARLAELDTLVNEGRVETCRIQQLSAAYSADTSAVMSAIGQSPSIANAQSMARRLQALKTQKDNILERLGASNPGAALAAAAGANIIVKDSTGSGAPGRARSVSGVTDELGVFRFLPKGSGEDRLSGLDAVIESDGRRAVVPLAGSAKADNRYSTFVEPSTRALELHKPTVFNLTLADGNGKPVASKRLRLVDRSRTCEINGVKGESFAWTDAAGRCSFSVNKTSLDAASRVELEVEESGWNKAGEILRLGGLDAGTASSSAGDVSVNAIGRPDNPQRVVLDNGIVRVAAEKSANGEILTSVSRTGNGGAAVPLFDTIVSEAGAVSGHVKTFGPRVAFSRGDAAGYETVLEMPVADGLVRKSYRVSLASGDPFAVVTCEVAVLGSALQLVGDNPGLVDTCFLRTPSGVELDVGGKSVRAPSNPGETTLLSFEVGNPYAAFKSGGDLLVAAYPLNSKAYPQAWSLTCDSIGARALEPVTLGESGFSMTVIVGVAGGSEPDSVVSRARLGVENQFEAPASGAGASDENGFLVVVEAGPRRQSGAADEITIRVLKKYESAF